MTQPYVVEVDPYARVEIYSHFFKLTRVQAGMKPHLFAFAERLVQSPKNNSWARPTGSADPFKVYCSKTSDNEEFRFHIGDWDDFIAFLGFRYVDIAMLDIVRMPMYKPMEASYKARAPYALRSGYQQQASDFILDDAGTPTHSRLVTVYTGGGKTVIATLTTARVPVRTLIVVLPTYMDKWGADICKYLDVEPKQVMTITGSSQIRGVLDLAKTDPKKIPAHLVISTTTMRNWLKLYELDRFGEEYKSYGIESPELFYELLGIGWVIYDEAHQHLFAVHWAMLYTHVDRLLALSGTFKADDLFISARQLKMFPKEIRFEGVAMQKYIDVLAMSYSIERFYNSGVKTTNRGRSEYSHTAFEKSVIKNQRLLNRYLDLIAMSLRYYYIERKKPGQKAAVYASTVEMCTLIKNHLCDTWPQLDIRRYVQDDPYANVIDADIRVTTLGSAGAAVDIPELLTVILTVAVNATVTNEQVLGRLRELTGSQTQFVYFFCEQIPKHIEYHRNRMSIIRDRVKSIKEVRAPTML